MTDFQTAINYLQQCIDQLKSEKEANDSVAATLKIEKDKLSSDVEALAASKSAFISQTKQQTAENEKARKMLDLANKLKLQVDEQTVDLTAKERILDEREEKIIDLEKKQQELEKREKAVISGEDDIANREILVRRREILVEKDKKAAREKQQDLDLKEKGIQRQRERLQKMIDAQNV